MPRRGCVGDPGLSSQFDVVWQKGDDLGEHRDQKGEGAHDDEERYGGACDAADALTGETLNHEKVKADRRCNLCQFDDDDDEDAEPDFVETGGQNQRQRDR